MLIAEKLSRRPVTFRRLTGVDVALFLKICKKIRPLWEKRRHNSENGGRPHSLCDLENHLLAMLLYYRCYVTYESLSYLFDCHETTVMRSVKRIEKLAAQVIHIKKNRAISSTDVEYLILDATEQPAQRPKKGQKKYYSGKKRRHTLKTQYIVGPDGGFYAVSRTYPGSVHDFTIYKDQKNRDRFLGIPKKSDKRIIFPWKPEEGDAPRSVTD